MLCPRGFETSRSECGESDLLKIAGVERPRSPIKLKLAPREGTLHPSFIPDGAKPDRRLYAFGEFESLRCHQRFSSRHSPEGSHYFVMRGLDPRICRAHEMAGSSPAMTVHTNVITVPGLDPGINPRIFGWREITGSSPVMTCFIISSCAGLKVRP